MNAGGVGVHSASVFVSTAVILPLSILRGEGGRNSRGETFHHQGDHVLRGELHSPLLDVLLEIGCAVVVRGVHLPVGPDSCAAVHQDHGRVARSPAAIESCRCVEHAREADTVWTREANSARQSVAAGCQQRHNAEPPCGRHRFVSSHSNPDLWERNDARPRCQSRKAHNSASRIEEVRSIAVCFICCSGLE
ncbi:hypothetical protein Mapa_005807 [Marchantia paleacea]|nr:hypothetical protein Mapa_005807 [Marchantia paleacea]